jgi:23S rRNA pseudouridine2457 synthase
MARGIILYRPAGIYSDHSVPYNRPMSYQYLAFHKPYGVLCQFRESEGRKTLKNYIPLSGVYSAGRLDYDSEGLLVLSDDGSLIHLLTDPRHHLTKTYWVQVEGHITLQAIEQLERGVLIQGKSTKRCRVIMIPEPDLPLRLKPITPHAPPSWIQIELNEGRKRQIRQMTAAVGFPTLRIIRVAIGALMLGDLKPGEWRYLTNEELSNLTSGKRFHVQ